MATTTQSDADIDRLFKRRYKALANNTFVQYDSVLSQLLKEQGGFGQDLRQTHQLSLPGSVGSSSTNILPQSNTALTIQPIWNGKKLYGTCEIDKYTIDNSRGSEDAIKSVLDYQVSGTVLSFNRNRARMFFNDATGVLGQFLGVATGTAADPIITIATTGKYKFRRRHFEVRDYVQIGAAGAAGVTIANAVGPFTTTALASIFEVVSVTTAGVVTLKRISGADDLTALGATVPYNVYMQNSQNADMIGLLGICLDSTINGIARQDRYQPFILPGTTLSEVSGAPLDLDMLTQVYDQYSVEADGASFTHIVTSPVQWRRLKSLMEAQKRQIIDTKVKPDTTGLGEKITASMGYSAIKFYGAESSCVIQQHRLVRDDMMFFFNKNYIVNRFLTPPHWEDFDGKTWMRVAGKDVFGSYYSAYGETQINPFHVGFIQGLSTTES